MRVSAWEICARPCPLWSFIYTYDIYKLGDFPLGWIPGFPPGEVPVCLHLAASADSAELGLRVLQRWPHTGRSLCGAHGCHTSTVNPKQRRRTMEEPAAAAVSGIG